MPKTPPSFFTFNKITLIAFTVSVAILTSIFLTVSFPTHEIKAPREPLKPFVSFYNLNETKQKFNLALKEQALLFDTEPIFIPTRWSQSPLPFNKAGPDPLFQDFPPIVRLYDRDQLLAIISEHPFNSKPIDILDPKLVNPFTGINQGAPNFLPLKKRTAIVSIENLNTSDITDAFEIPESPDVQLNEELWPPIELLLIIDQSGPIMPLLITQGSGTEEIDNFFKNQLSKPNSKINSLPSGYYKISVSP